MPLKTNAPQTNRIRGGGLAGFSFRGRTKSRTLAVLTRTSSGLAVPRPRRCRTRGRRSVSNVPGPVIVWPGPWWCRRRLSIIGGADLQRRRVELHVDDVASCRPSGAWAWRRSTAPCRPGDTAWPSPAARADEGDVMAGLRDAGPRGRCAAPRPRPHRSWRSGSARSPWSAVPARSARWPSPGLPVDP